MPMGLTVSVELTALLAWLLVPAVLFWLLVVLYPPYLRWRVGKWEDLRDSAATRAPGSSASDASRDTGVRSRTFHAPGT